MSYYYQFLNKVYAYYKKVGYKAGEESRIITFIVASGILTVQFMTLTVLLLNFCYGNNRDLLLGSSIVEGLTNKAFDLSNFELLFFMYFVMSFLWHLYFFRSRPFSKFLSINIKDILLILLWGMGSFGLYLFVLIPE